MKELAFPFDELDDYQDLNRFGPRFGRRGKLRYGGRVALHEAPDTPRVAVILRRIRDHFNTDPSILTDPEEVSEADPKAVALPPLEILRSIGVSACELLVEHLDDSRKN
jgi:hypothetical protein